VNSNSRAPRTSQGGALAERFHVERGASGLTVTWHWRDDGHGPLLVFLAVIVALFAVGWFWAAVNLKPEDTGFRNAGFWWVFFSALLTYGALTSYLNRTVLTATRERLSLRSGPLPAALSRELDASEVTQLWCEKHERRSEDRITPDTYYSLNATLKDGRVVRFVKDFTRREDAQALERLIESYLGIADRAASGEV
jgi:hypothetical protein